MSLESAKEIVRRGADENSAESFQFEYFRAKGFLAGHAAGEKSMRDRAAMVPECSMDKCQCALSNAIRALPLEGDPK